MIVYGLEILNSFCNKYPQAKSPIARWQKIVEENDFKHFPDLKQILPKTDYDAPYAIFDIGGTNYRLIAKVYYNHNKIIIEHVFTHEEYDKWNNSRKKGRYKT